MQLPPNLKAVTGVLPNVAANTLSSTVLLAAPGATLRYRLWATVGQYEDTTQAPTKGIWRIDAPAGVSVWRASMVGFEGVLWTWPGGYLVAANTSVSGAATSDLLNVARRVWLYYTIEAVS